ncbi:Solute carrier family 23 member 1 [Orchesella cincta]|uniref:Solute carrier family 23 member 1 n=1 Tax=Orchesella cincta TaxID=48709 RepID=A0A1D2N3A2_ORCCI|nr:Solute carrier family 23 member 1 [Orchesella cincta]
MIIQWGIPTVSIGAVVGVLCGVLTSTVESMGDYCCCANVIRKKIIHQSCYNCLHDRYKHSHIIIGAPVPPEHAMNRGIFVEGFGCVLSAIFGTGNASTSYSSNIGTLAVTKVGSRRVIQVAGVIMVCLGLVGKAGSIFVSLPDPILGGMFLFLFPLVMAVGLATLKDVNLESSRNIFIVSFSIFLFYLTNMLTLMHCQFKISHCPLDDNQAISQWINTHPGLINTGTLELDSLIQILLSTGMFVAGFTAFILDNTISGTDEERGLAGRQAAEAASKICRDTSYDLPFGMSIIKK